MGVPVGSDLEHRDPRDINEHVKVAYEDVFAEPDGAHSAVCVWQCSYQLFTGGKDCCYHFWAAACGCWTALFWGFLFGMTTWWQVWCCTPAIRIVSIYCTACQKYTGTCLQCILAPFCETCGLLFSRIIISLTTHSQKIGEKLENGSV